MVFSGVQRPDFGGLAAAKIWRRSRTRRSPRTDHQAELDRIRRDAADAQHQVAAEHAETLRGLRADLSAAAERHATEHAGQLAELHRQLGAADHEIEVLRTRLATNPAVAGSPSV
jgi:chromosome segregation ATPase